MNLRQIFNIPKTLTVYVDNQRTDYYVPDGSINKPYKELKTAMDSIVDASSTKRYAVVVHNGFYFEDNPITIKNYVFVQGDFKHNPRIIPLNQNEPLFVHPTGAVYPSYDFGELTFVAPKNSAIFYAGANAHAVGGFYYCLFISQGGAGSLPGQICEAFHHEEPIGGYHLVNCMVYSEYWNNSKFTTFANMTGGNYRDTGMHIHDGTIMDNYLRLTGEGHCEVDLLLTDTSDIKEMYYINSIDARFMLSNQVASKPGGKTLTAGAGTIRVRNSDMWGENYFGECSTVGIQTTEFLLNGYIYGYKPTELIVTQCKNINTATYCLYCLGENTRIHTTGNSFVSPLGTPPVQLDGTFISIETQGVSQYDVPLLTVGSSEIFKHLPDMSYARVCQISRYSSAKDDSLDFATTKEAEYYQENGDKTDFISGEVQLAGIGISTYAHWMLNELSGTNAADSSGNGRDGTAVNSPSWVTGKLNKCLQFNGINQYVNCGDIANFERTQSCSYEFWFNTTSVDTRLFLSNMEMPTPKGMRIAMMSGNIDIGFYNSGSNILKVHTSLTFNDGIFHHCIISYNGSSLASGIKIYVDNILQSVIIDNNNLTATILNTATFRIAGRADAIYFFNGKLDEVIIYDKELSVSEVAFRWNSGAGTESTGYDNTKGWYVRTNINQIDTSTWYNIGKITLTQTTPTNTDIRYLFSVDNRVTWRKWTGAIWESVDLANIGTQGHTKAEVELLTDSQWSALFVAGTLDIVASLKTTNTTVTPSLGHISVNYLTGYRHLCYDADLKVEFIDATHTKVTNTINPPETLYGLKVNIFMLTPF
jgi:hypothetical protein